MGFDGVEKSGGSSMENTEKGTLLHSSKNASRNDSILLCIGCFIRRPP